MGVKVETTLKVPNGKEWQFRVDEFAEGEDWYFDSDGSYRILGYAEEEGHLKEKTIAEYPKEKVLRLFKYDSTEDPTEQNSSNVEGKDKEPPL